MNDSIFYFEREARHRLRLSDNHGGFAKTVVGRYGRSDPEGEPRRG